MLRDKNNENYISDSEILEAFALLSSSKDLLPPLEYEFLKKLIEKGRLRAFKEQFDESIVIAKNNSSIGISENLEHELEASLYKSKNNINNNPSLDSIINKYTKIISENNHKNKKLIEEIQTLRHNINDKEELITEFTNKINGLVKSNNELQTRFQQSRIDQKIPEYVDNVKADLGGDDIHFIRMSKNWAFAGGALGLAAVIFSFISLYFSIDFDKAKGFELFYFFSRGLIGISILTWLSYICLSNAKKYTHESIRRKDRRHALMFGQVFLQIYGSTATKEDAIQVFKDWNMSGDSAFSDQTDHPPSIHTLLDIAKEKFRSSTKEKSAENVGNV